MTTILKHCRTFISQLMSEQISNNYLFHNLSLTKNTVGTAEELIEGSSERIEGEEVMVASWFLYAGFSKGYENHVEKSQKIVRQFLHDQDYGNDKVERIVSLVGAAWNSEAPNTIEEGAIKDIRTFRYASNNLSELLELERMEMDNLGQNPPSQNQWYKNHIEILRTDHRYYTVYALENWQAQKEDNIISLIKKAAKIVKTKQKEKLKVKLKNQSPERAIQSMYRTQLRNHLKLSDIADTKANILLSVNAIIISLLLANLIPKLGVPSNSYLIYPTVIFVVFSIASIIMSVLATRPKIENKAVVEGDIQAKNANHLFFGNFHALESQAFKEKIRDIIESKETIYDSLTLDLYYLGKVLQSKYQLLRWTYTIFMVGIILSVLAFAIALHYFGMEQEIIDAVTPKPKV